MKISKKIYRLSDKYIIEFWLIPTIRLYYYPKREFSKREFGVEFNFFIWKLEIDFFEYLCPKNDRKNLSADIRNVLKSIGITLKRR